MTVILQGSDPLQHHYYLPLTPVVDVVIVIVKIVVFDVAAAIIVF